MMTSENMIMINVYKYYVTIAA